MIGAGKAALDEYNDEGFIPATDPLLELLHNSIIVDSETGDLVADQMVYAWVRSCRDNTDWPLHPI